MAEEVGLEPTCAVISDTYQFSRLGL